MQYAKIVNDRLIYPTAAEFAGIPNWEGHDKMLRRRGYMPVPNMPAAKDRKSVVIDTFEVMPAVDTMTEPRQVSVKEYSEDPITHEMVETGEHFEMQDQDVTINASYIRITGYHYEDVLEQSSSGTPSVIHYSKYLLKRSCERHGLWEDVKGMIENAGKWESFLLIQDISNDNEEFQEVLPSLYQVFGEETVNTVLSESISGESI